MAAERRWDPCVAHRGDEVESFIAEYFADTNRMVLFIAGAGFDPRSTAIATRLAQVGAAVRAVLFQENRPKPTQQLVERAAANVEALSPHYSRQVGFRSVKD